MNVSITPELEKFINDKVASGMYGSASEVVREALRLLSEHDAYRRRRIEELRREIDIGWEAAERGEFVSAEELEEDLDKLFAEFEQKQ
jgi:antitoxin ParD1/3/4